MKTIAAIHVAKKQLGLDEDTYRAVLKRVTGKDSLKLMSGSEQMKVVEHFRQQGFKPASSAGRKALAGPLAKKLQALWIGAWNLGLVKNRDDAALLAFVKRQTGIDHTRFLTHAADAAKAVEALKAWMARDGGVDWAVTPAMSDALKLSGFKIAQAQLAKILGRPAKGLEFYSAVINHIPKAPEYMVAEADWVPVMNAFGKEVRAKRAAA